MSILISNIYAQSSSDPASNDQPAQQAQEAQQVQPAQQAQEAQQVQPAQQAQEAQQASENTGYKIEEVKIETASKSNGGCLIATATYGSELAPQVQQLRELRDNSLLQTESGSSFMKSFNQFYYSFSPTIADLERENPAFKEMVRIAITPMLSSLSILNYVDMDSEASVLGYGISLILLNIGIYFVAPGIVIVKLKQKL